MVLIYRIFLLTFGIVLMTSCQGRVEAPIEAAAAQVSPRLMIMGGGTITSSIHESFLEMAGPSPTLVLIATATRRDPKPDKWKALWEKRGFRVIYILHTDEEFYTPSVELMDALDKTTAVWFSGGSQSRIAKSHCGTILEEKLYEFLEKGGLIGGSSAGAAIQSEVMIASGSTEPRISRGFDFLEGAIIDQHFIARGRLPRLISAIEQYPERTGYGIDESTALIVEGDRLRVVGESYVLRVRQVDGEIKIGAFKAGDVID